MVLSAQLEGLQIYNAPRLSKKIPLIISKLSEEIDVGTEFLVDQLFAKSP